MQKLILLQQINRDPRPVRQQQKHRLGLYFRLVGYLYVRLHLCLVCRQTLYIYRHELMTEASVGCHRRQFRAQGITASRRNISDENFLPNLDIPKDIVHQYFVKLLGLNCSFFSLWQIPNP